ncbi:beta-ketoacyl synthase N-terminal-like domain-containing protein, partial [Methylogaea oryzae]|uniref:beta-ketoacyl synthase N-terminal-like domain-containing protein n=1 Tax=Methylogaea oryzae TaxID=1295382 RepID=UPI0035711273
MRPGFGGRRVGEFDFTGYFSLPRRRGMASHSGASRTFDDNADGFVPGEGAGVVVLKRLA